jgi:hypothetical protein
MRCVKGLAAVVADRRTGVLGVFGVVALLLFFFFLWLILVAEFEVPNVASSSFHVMTVLLVDVGVTAACLGTGGGGVKAAVVDVGVDLGVERFEF